MENNKPCFVKFFEKGCDEVRHYGLLLADSETVVCACCGGTFDKEEDITILQSCEWDGESLYDFIEGAFWGL